MSARGEINTRPGNHERARAGCEHQAVAWKWGARETMGQTQAGKSVQGFLSTVRESDRDSQAYKEEEADIPP